MPRSRRVRTASVISEDDKYSLMKYAEFAVRGADAIYRDAFDVRCQLGDRRFKKILKAAEDIVHVLGPYLPL